MTTIAYKNKKMVCDSCHQLGGLVISLAPKIFKLKNGVLIGIAGDSEHRALIKLLKNIRTPSDFPSSQELLKTDIDCGCILVFPDGSIYLCDVNLPKDGRKIAEFIKISRNYFAVGSGKELALGAMAAGKSAEEAIKIACEFDINSRLPLHIEKL